VITKKHFRALGLLRDLKEMPMTTRARTVAVAVAMATVLTVAACTDPVQAPPATSTSPGITTRTSTPTSTTPADPKLAGAEEVVAKFWALVDALGADNKRSLDELNLLSRNQTLETWRELLTVQRRQGLKQTGTVSFVSSKAASVDGKLTVDTCIDVSKTNLVDQQGKSVVAANRPRRVRYNSILEQGTDGKFYIVQDKAVGTC